ncbi:MAG: beta-aspartyl-peptidase [Bacteroidia bacterium]|nr:MAG: beta-aspartyl-peptidase [Bacteroidia bacterium]
MLLIKNAEIFAPANLGRRDILIAGNTIVAMEKQLTLPPGLPVEVLDVRGMRVIPGLIDSHIHIAGAGGEGGPASRTPEMPLSMMLEAGVTTVVGCLGTDGMTRNLESVLMKAKGLKQEGVSAYMYTGAYQIPTPTILGDVGKDIAMIEEVIGTGEIALSDHRSSCPTLTELIRLATHSRVGAMLGGKSGIVNIHMGDAENPFQPLYDAVEMSELKLTQFLPTHCNRNDYIFEDAKTYGKQGYVDLTTSAYPFFPDEEIKPSTGIAELLRAGVPEEHITLSSDGCGSLPQFDEQGKLVKLETGTLKSMFDELNDAVTKEDIPLETALKTVTSNVAAILKLEKKGRIATGMDADLVIVDDAFNIIHLCAMGKLLVKNGKTLRHGSYES